MKVFEVGHPGTQSVKVEMVREIFGFSPGRVVYVPIDFNEEMLGQKLLEKGHDRSKKAPFVVEGRVMYIPLEAVDDTHSFIRENSGKGSSVYLRLLPGLW